MSPLIGFTHLFRGRGDHVTTNHIPNLCLTKSLTK